MIDRHRENLLKNLAEIAPFTVIGSAALGIFAPHVITERPRDLDLLVPRDLDHLNALARGLKSMGFQLFSWNEPISLPLSPRTLTGRFYMRAKCGGETIDLTYECAPLPFTEAWKRRVLWRSIPLACLQHITRLMSVRANSRDEARLNQLGMCWPSAKNNQQLVERNSLLENVDLLLRSA